MTDVHEEPLPVGSDGSDFNCEQLLREAYEMYVAEEDRDAEWDAWAERVVGGESKVTPEERIAELTRQREAKHVVQQEAVLVAEILRSCERLSVEGRRKVAEALDALLRTTEGGSE